MGRRLPMQAVFRILIEGAAILGLVALSQRLSYDCSLSDMAHVASIATLIGEIGLCASVGLYLSVCVSRRARSTLRRVMGIFALTALSAGTLTWAAGTSQTTSQCVHQSVGAHIVHGS
jgi:hypothetical protein